MGVCVPEEYGGAGADFLSYILVLEELSRADAGVGVTVAVHTSATTLPILAFGTDEQKSRFVPPLARGEVLGAFALTEPEAGSDAGSLRTQRRADGDGWTITGAKQWITNGRYAGTFLLFARTDRDDRRRARRLGVRPRRRARSRDARRGEARAQLVGDERHRRRGRARRAATACCTRRTRASRVAMATLDGGRIGIAAQALGIAQAAYDVARAYAQERRAFGQRIARLPGDPVEARRHVDGDRRRAPARLPRGVAEGSTGAPHTEEGAKAKLFASEMARRQTAEAIQILGGYGYTKEFPVERYYRDAKITEIYEGTSEIQRLVIARQILGSRDRVALVRLDELRRGVLRASAPSARALLSARSAPPSRRVASTA